MRGMNNAALSNLLPNRFADFVREPSHPCAMAKSVISRGAVDFGVYASLGSEHAAQANCNDLYESLRKPRGGDYWSYVAIFPDNHIGDEAQFELRMWEHLQRMHDFDASRHDWDGAVSTDPDDANFSFSIGGQGWYVIGLHPEASRLARRWESPALVFNPHGQFDDLRARGKYSTVRNLIRQRDVRLQGSINPMLADHGDASEARQYSGRAVPESWKCPLRVS